MIKLKRGISTSFTILCLLSIPLIMEYGLSVKTEPTIWYVDDDNVTGPWDGTKEYPYQNITNALEHTIDEDTIFVYEGTYYENVFVNKSVSLVGEDRETTIIDGGERGSVIFVTANSVNINGFTIQRSGRALYDSGIFVERSSDNDISHNTMTNNYEGISLHYSSNNLVSGNTISSNNNDGISLYSSSNNVVSGNTITNNNYGISLYSSSNNVVSGNTISSNNNNGMYITLYSGNNIVYCNNFNNTYQVWSDPTNVWDDGDKGNYWSDYTGQDLNGDGIGDKPYVIDVNNQDKHPLMGTFSDFNVAWQDKTYHATTICNSTISNFRFETGAETGNKIISFSVTGEDGTVGFCRVTIPMELMEYPYVVLVGAEEIVPTLLDVSNEAYVSLYFTYIHSNHAITIISSRARKLEIDLYNLNATYHALLDNYSTFLGNYSELQESYRELNTSLEEHLLDYSENVHNIRNLMYIFAATTAIFIITTIYLSKRAHEGKASARTRTQTKKRTHIPLSVLELKL